MLKALHDKINDPNVVRIYLTTLGLGTAYGMAISVIAVFLDQRGYKETQIGTLAAWFAAGIMVTAVASGQLVSRFGAKRVLVAALFTYAATVALFPFAPGYAAIAGLRFFDGAASVCVWVASETILLARAQRSIKAFITSLYAMSIAVGYGAGSGAAFLAADVLPNERIFLVSGAITIVTAIFVALRLDKSSDTHREEHGSVSAADGGTQRAPLGVLIGRIKASCFATFCYGYFQSSVVLFLPLFMKNEKGIPQDQTRLITFFFAGGMLLATNFAGRIGDRHGHLLVMRILAIVGTTMVASFVWLNGLPAMAVAVFVAGASLASISPLSLALQGLQTREYSRATGIYNAFYAAGMLLGPPISSQIFHLHGGGPMLYHLAALWAAFIVFAQIFRRDDPALTRGPIATAPLATPEAD
ncbi:MAG: permease of the major facilitator superfamily [Polyangiaceae bacterium]|jgi:MFS family permease|nr:permease of the major facilitator superfamily [Polyangiaceae bacterium]